MTTCPDCHDTGFVVGELSSSRVRCLRCNADGHRTFEAPADDRNEHATPFADEHAETPLDVPEPAHT